MQLLILRHAKSSWSHPELEDHDRPLNKRGLRDAPRMGRWIREQKLEPDLVLSSSAVRAYSTARLALEAARCKAEVRLEPELYLAAPATYLEHLSRLSDAHRRVMVVGHNPGLEELLHLLTGAEDAMPTAALADVRLSAASWSVVDGRTRGTLAGYWRPKTLPADV
jgi:phosphohistidine phosphatase